MKNQNTISFEDNLANMKEIMNPAEAFTRAIDEKFGNSTQQRSGDREFEQSLVLDHTAEDPPLLDTPVSLARDIKVKRPIPGFEREAATKWGVSGGHRIEIEETHGQGPSTYSVYFLDGDELKGFKYSTALNDQGKIVQYGRGRHFAVSPYGTADLLNWLSRAQVDSKQ